jgi:TonB family protein
LVTSPQMSGKVDVRFVIGAEGDVLKAQVDHSTTHDPVLDGCLAARFRSWQFPKPKGGGVVEVSYPIILQRTGGT